MTKFGVVAILMVSVQSVISIELAIAEPSNSVHSSRHPAAKGQTSVGVKTIEPKEGKERQESGWNGSYVGVNAGAGFGATAGSNMLFPLGTSSDK